MHPGIVGDRGPSALDWAIADGERQWGVTVLQATAEMDAGPVWATETFAMREATKSSLYRNEVTDGAARAVVAAVQRFADGGAPPPIDAAARRGRWRPLMRQAERRIDWQRDDTQTVLRKIRAADGTPGVLDELFGAPCHLFDAHPEVLAQRETPGRVIGRRHEAVLRATVDGAVWIGHVRRADPAGSFKLPTALAFPTETSTLPELPLAIDDPAVPSGWREIRYEADGDVGALHFPFYNGAMSTAQCERLTAALRFALAQPPRVLLLLGGPDFWANGIHLNVIEAADSPADESWRNINAIDDLTQTLIEATDRIVIAAMQGNAGAGGVFMALAADQVWARRSVVLNPHYKNMGNLFGSEYWTYLLPRRLKSVTAGDVMGHRLPMSAAPGGADGPGRRGLRRPPGRVPWPGSLAGGGVGRWRGHPCAVAGQGAATPERRGAQAARHLPRGGAGPDAAQLLRLRPELPHRALELRPPRRPIVDAAPPGAPPWPRAGRAPPRTGYPRIARVAVTGKISRPRGLPVNRAAPDSVIPLPYGDLVRPDSSKGIQMKLLSTTLAALATLAISSTAFAGAAEDLIKTGKCANCHTAATTKKGPSWASVAEKYKGKADAEAKLVTMLKTGGADDHNKVAASDADLKAIVAIVLSSK